MPQMPEYADLNLREMLESDIPYVHSLETAIYPFPWTVGIFKDCMGANYRNWVLTQDDFVVGFVVVTLVVGEAHLLNICVDSSLRGRGIGRALLREVLDALDSSDVESMFLEVRVSNRVAMALYQSMGFIEIGRRKDYYPTKNGREDAILMQLPMM